MRALACLTLLLALALAAPAFAEPPGEARIRWDNWGVPHIEAESIAAGHYALGWAMARGRPDQLLELLGQGRGRAAELWGEEYLATDVLMWRFGIPQALDAIYAAQGETYQRRLDAFAAGINDWFAAHPESGSAERRRALPVSARDVLGHSQRTTNFAFMASDQLDGLQRMLETPISGPDPWAPPPGEDGATEPGSNAWAIAPSRSASGDALLLANPHLPWGGFFTWFEAHMTAPGMNAYGVALLGQPLMGIAFNERLGWTHTVNRHDAVDIYALPLVDGGYRFGEETRAFEEGGVTLRVRQPNGGLADRRITLRNAVHGPVVGQRDGMAYAVRIAGIADPDYGRGFEQLSAMITADGRAEWEAALARLQLPMFNAIYADRAGEIVYVSNGLHPVRARGDAAFWAGIVDGSNPALLWTEYHPYGRLLRVADPAAGFVQNANETGYTSTIPPALDPADFPADFIPPDMRSRPQHSLEMLLADTSISLDELIAYAHSTRLAFADNVLDALIAAARADPREPARRAVDVLAAWDRRTEIESRGAVLFSLWALGFAPTQPGGVYQQVWSFAAPTAWPDGIADDAAAVTALIATVENMTAANIPLDMPWGEFARSPDGAGGTLPSSLGMGPLGAFRVGFFEPDPAGGPPVFNGGTSWVAAIEFGERADARAILPYGNFAARPDGVDEQYSLFSRGELRAVNFDEAAIAAATAFEERPGAPAGAAAIIPDADAAPLAAHARAP